MGTFEIKNNKSSKIKNSESSGWKARLTETTVGLFSHAPDPLEETFQYPDDPGLFGPESITWKIMGDVSSFIGGIRALLIQAAHPEVAAGVANHSTYRDDPLGRLSRTASYVTATAFGAMPEVEKSIKMVSSAHRPVVGTSSRGEKYSAGNPEMAAWVHNALIDSFLVSYQNFGPFLLKNEEADSYVYEQTNLGNLMKASPLPENAASLSCWLSENPKVGSSKEGAEAVSFLKKPPLPFFTRIAYKILFNAAVVTMPIELREAIGVNPKKGSKTAGNFLTKVLRYALGSSPAWAAALDRSGTKRPNGIRFRNTSGVTR
ncbi:MAG: hypothetical protein CL452_07305 [Acidimicrobiaceae bacterium]|nr:hypothetical protein [Acidimicrobiaceae bacterium]MBD27527.1 hypothetical protein [Acidimicrobiaceae bacterium]CAI8357976.1 MAG: Uncharacterised protein [Acidimicrobiaceae bacterium]